MTSVTLAKVSGALTLDLDMPARLTIEQAAARIEAKINEKLEAGERRRVTPSIIRRMMARKHPAVALMQRYGKYETRPRRHWRFTTGSVDWAAKRWPSPDPGRPREITPEIEATILELRHEGGKTLQQIADELQAAGVPNPSGGSEWDTSSILLVIVRHDAESEAGQLAPAAEPTEGRATRIAVLELLRGGQFNSAQGIAAELGLTPNAVRQHLSNLEREGQVRSVPVRTGKRGQALFVYSLTDDSDGGPEHGESERAHQAS